ncbi:hypothetical protein [Leptothermofonsia sp. ETS-13]|uniref:hypothetical protein n=1 Tax=Leptothermofonsia sp. ETS-13 TaxID=3035696 RepID=UPI003BA05947
MLETKADIIAQMISYMQNVLEKPHPVFGGLPICPFARKARLEKKVLYHVYRFVPLDRLNPDVHLMQFIQDFSRSKQYEALLVINPDRQALTLDELQQFVEGLNEVIAPYGLIAFGGHPQEPFNIQGVYTRREPFINFTVQTQEKVKAASDALLKTHYYDYWSEENLKQVGFPRH